MRGRRVLFAQIRTRKQGKSQITRTLDDGSEPIFDRITNANIARSQSVFRLRLFHRAVAAGNSRRVRRDERREKANSGLAPARSRQKSNKTQ